MTYASKGVTLNWPGMNKASLPALSIGSASITTKYLVLKKILLLLIFHQKGGSISLYFVLCHN